MTDKTNEKRRKVLKTAGVATVAAGAWQKPVLNSVMTPAHAQMSMMIVGAGGSSSTPPMVMLNKNSNSNIADRALETLIPNAHAGVAPGEVLNECEAFTSTRNDDNMHCVSLTFPNGEDRSGEVTVSVNGPVLYYGPNCAYYYLGEIGEYYYSYRGSFQINDSATVTMDDGDFEVMLDGVTVFGSVNEDFDNATGTLIYQGPSESIGGANIGYASGYYCSSFGNYGAYWAAELGTGSSCTIGMGAEGNGNNIVIEGSCEGGRLDD